MMIFLRTPLYGTMPHENKLLLRLIMIIYVTIFNGILKFFNKMYVFLEELREHFSSYGDIESINVKTDPNTGRSRGFAFIVFAKAESLDKVKIFSL